MSDVEILPDPESPINFAALPPKALQAVYHAATGKVESTEKSIRRNVVIDNNAIENLYERLCQEFDVENLLSDPTITVVIRYDEDGVHTYSSWERFQKISSIEDKTTSSIEIKFEAVLKVSGTGDPQRLIVTVGLDSALPILEAEQKKKHERIDFGWFAFSKNSWKTIVIKVDYVDYTIAKNFIFLVEKWGNCLPSTESRDFALQILASMPIISGISAQFGRLGASLFFIFYYVFSEEINLASSMLALGISGIIWSTFDIFRRFYLEKLVEDSAKSIVPSVILMSDYDRRVYGTVLTARGPSPLRRLFGFIMWSAFTVLLNISSSYIFAHYIDG